MGVQTKLKAQSGLSISRNAFKFTFEWKLGDSEYTTQELQWGLNGKWNGKVNKDKVKKGTTKYTVTLDKSTKFNQINFRVKATKKNKKTKNKLLKTDWVNHKWAVNPPSNPVLTAELDVNDASRTNFVWATNHDDSGHNIATHCVTQTKKVMKSTKNPNWSGATVNNNAGLSGSYTTPENAASFGNDTKFSFTRWFRVKSVGPAGDSLGKDKKTYWATKYHTYSYPNRTGWPKLTYKKKANLGCNITVSWKLSAQFYDPVDYVKLQYLIGTPQTSMVIETVGGVTYGSTIISAPNSSGTDVVQLSGGVTNGEKQNYSFNLPSEPGTNEMIWIRLVTTHDRNTSETAWFLFSSSSSTGYVGKLSKPTGLGVREYDPTTRKAVVKATNNANAISDSFLIVYIRSDDAPSTITPIGIITSADTNGVQVIVPKEIANSGKAFSLGVQAYVGSYSYTVQNDGSRRYEVFDSQPQVNNIEYSDYCSHMESDINWDGGSVALPPKITADKYNNTCIRVYWSWSWANATGIELSWSTNREAWTSTKEPTVYTVKSTRSSYWFIEDLEPGIYYIRARFIREHDGETTYGTYCQPYSIKISEAPYTPALSAQPDLISINGSVNFVWSYSSPDGTAQQSAHIYSVNMANDGSFTVDTPIAYIAANRQSHKMTISDIRRHINWTYGEKKYFVVAVRSESNETAMASTPVAIQLAPELSIAISSSSVANRTVYTYVNLVPANPHADGLYELVNNTYVLTTDTTPVSGKDYYDKDIKRALVQMTSSSPLSVTITGAPADSDVTVMVQRADPYHVDRPDESHYDGYDDEVVAIVHTEGSLTIPIAPGDESLIGSIDDGAHYKISATVKDSYGQRADSNEIDFWVHWTHQAIIPNGTAVIDKTNLISKITPIAPTGTGTGDYCDIYRLSTDVPQLIYGHASFGTTYVDPYPTFGNNGGHRIVFRTVNGDYITQDNTFAWLDLDDDYDDILDYFAIVIDFDGKRLTLPYNVSLSDKWKKDFTETKYLGGAVTGDWNPAVSRTGSHSASIPVEVDNENIQLLRRLADYAGICHVRTPDGSSYAANVEVKESREEKWVSQLAKVTLDITRVDPQGFDAITLAEWEAEQNPEVEEPE